jgi:HSP20 family protein
MDLYDDGHSPTIYAMLELPGVSRDNISVKVQDGLLVVDGRRASPLLDRIDIRGGNSDAATPAFKIKELKYGAFHREITLPQNSTVRTIVY